MQEPTFAATGKGLWSRFSLRQDQGSYLGQLDTELRFNQDGEILDQFLAEITAGSQLNRYWQFGLGCRFTFNDQDVIGDLQEIRLSEHAIFSHNAFSFRSRIEQRKAFTRSEIANRLRERIGYNYRMSSHFSLNFYNELFINLNQASWIGPKTLDQNRLFLGLTHHTSKQLTVTINYLYQSIFSSPVINNQIVRLSVVYSPGAS